MRLFQKVIVFVLFSLIVQPVLSDEGMWMPHQMKELNLKEFGLKMNPENLFKKDGSGLMSAVVNLGGGTGEFVSNQGLILTNHHVAFGALQRASDPEHDYIEKGFVAWDKTQELPAQGYIADVLLGYKEVTQEVLSVMIRNMTFREKFDAIDKKTKQIIADAEKGGKDLRCRIANMYSGNRYYLFTFKRLKDIRLVYAPPKDLGNFGGDVDNWMWPRHTCDFSFLRAFVSKENIGVEYDEENVPYSPKSIIKISLEGVKDGDFTFVMGYPGRTYRNYTLSELLNDVERMKQSIVNRKDLIAFYEDAGKENKAVQIKYASKIKGLNNGLKNYQGKLEGFQKVGLLEKKKETEKSFLEWIKKEPKRNEIYSEALISIDNFMKKYAVFSKKNRLISNLLSSYYGSTLLSQAHTIYRAVQERQKPDMERESGFQERNWDRLKQRIRLAERGYDFNTDKAFLKIQLIKLFDRPESEIPDALQELVKTKSEKDVGKFVDNLYSQTNLADPETRLEYIEKTPNQFKKKKDPLIKLVSELEAELKTLREKNEELGQERLELKKVYLEALLLKVKDKIAPDANGTIRFTYGDVLGYSPKDAVYLKPVTTVRGVIEKETGEFPFRVPEKLKTLYKAKDYGLYLDNGLKEVPACFLNTTNVTGGNSGSPTLNANGEQVGIIFDMTYESVIGDYFIIPEWQRTISVDIRYVLFVTDKFSGAKHLLKEMELQ
jgi:hypothetical protein